MKHLAQCATPNSGSVNASVPRGSVPHLQTGKSRATITVEVSSYTSSICRRLACVLLLTSGSPRSWHLLSGNVCHQAAMVGVSGLERRGVMEAQPVFSLSHWVKLPWLRPEGLSCHCCSFLTGSCWRLLLSQPPHQFGPQRALVHPEPAS